MKTLGIVQDRLPGYRIPLFQRLSRRLRDDVGLHLVVYVSRAASPRNDSPPPDGFDVRKLSDVLGPRTRQGLHFRRWKTVAAECDAVVVEQALSNLENWPLVMRMGGPPVAFWGHGSPSTSRPLFTALRDAMTRRGDWFFAYTEESARHVAAHGVSPDRITVLNNTLDTGELREALEGVGADDVTSFCGDLNLSPEHTALFIGGLDAAKDLAFLVSVARAAEWHEPGFTLLVVGDGPDRARLASVQSAGGPVRLMGYANVRSKAMALSASRCLIIPSGVGLVAVDSLCSGVPIITRANRTHGPEAHYLRRGQDSLWLDAGVSAGDFAGEVLQLMHNEALLLSMKKACLARRDQYSLDAMLDAFVTGVCRWLSLPGG